MKTVLLIYGGVSGEHEVSCVSAAFLETSLQNAGFKVLPVYISHEGVWHLQDKVHKIPAENLNNPCHISTSEPARLQGGFDSVGFDLVFPIIHGTMGEDGRLQGMLDFLQLPYTGSGMLASALCMHKGYMRQVFARHDLPQVEFQLFHFSQYQRQRDEMVQAICAGFSWPVFVKPCNMGSSVGISKVKSAAELGPALELAFAYDQQILVEQGHSVDEIELSILGNFPDYSVSIAGEIIPHHEFYSYEAKYLDENGASMHIPARLDAGQLEQLQEMARQAFSAVQGDGFARVDFFRDRKSGRFYINEINSLPGFTPVSMYPKLWEASGLPADQLVKKLVELALERFEQNKRIRHSI